MKPLSERDENVPSVQRHPGEVSIFVGMKPLSERDENPQPIKDALNKL